MFNVRYVTRHQLTGLMLAERAGRIQDQVDAFLSNAAAHRARAARRYAEAAALRELLAQLKRAA